MAKNITITNNSANTTETIVAISFLCNMFYNLSYYSYENKLNNTAINSYIVLLNSLGPIIQIFSNYL